jgi:hypothetical protein
MKTRLLRVVGPRFVAGAEFEKRGDEWALVRCAPILGWMRNHPVLWIRTGLRRRRLEWEWLP